MQKTKNAPKPLGYRDEKFAVPPSLKPKLPLFAYGNRLYAARVVTGAHPVEAY